MIDKQHIYFVYQDTTIFSFHIDNVKEGITLGPDIKNLDIHLTSLFSEGKIRSHVHHGRVNEPKDSPIGKTTSINVVSKKIEKMLKNRLKPYHGNTRCYAFTKDRNERIKTFLPKVDDKGDIIVPIELYLSQLDIDFRKKELWDRIRICELLDREPHYGFVETKKGIRQVLPVSKNLMLLYPLKKGSEIEDYIAGVIGFDDLLEYLDLIGVSDQIKTQIKRRLNMS